MTVFLDRIDSVPVLNNNFTADFSQWAVVLVDTINESLRKVQDGLNLPLMPLLTSAEIVALDPNLPNGVIMYDTDLDEYVGKQAGVLVKFTVTPYP